MNPDRLDSSKLITTAGGETTILAESGRIRGFIILTDGTNAATLVIHDGPVATGPLQLKGKCGGSAFMSGAILDGAIKCGTSIVAQVTGTGAEALILYSK